MTATTKSILIVYAHPYSGSFNHAVLETITQNLTRQKQAYTVIDLYQDQFKPVYDAEELRLFHTGQTHDPLVTKYLALLKNAGEIIFVTPIWWNALPAMLKGFIDKVMKEGEDLTHTVTKTGVKGCLTNLKQAYVFTTSTSPTLYFKLMSGNSIQKIFINKTLKQLGIKKAKWVNFGGITNSTVQQRQRFLSRCNELQFTH
ncbi:MAG: NAD(P)H-dependent oxidoreductase [Lactobacillus sp.]|jgi:putative NADPH-quinone reductase|nr:NAD(P)H-dependent oxidoreductase [Lactobacillus sp.]